MVDFAGLDCCLIKVEHLKRMGTPYFRGESGSNLIQSMHFDFSSRTRKLGGRIVGCLDHYLPHDLMTDDVNENIKEVYHYMSQKKIEPEGVKKKGENKRKEYDKMLSQPLTDIPVHILTPTARPQNLKMVNDSIYKSNGPHNLALNWHIMYKNMTTCTTSSQDTTSILTRSPRVGSH